MDFDFSKEECAFFKKQGGVVDPRNLKSLSNNLEYASEIVKYCNTTYDDKPCSNYICELTQNNVDPFTFQKFDENDENSRLLKNYLLQKCLNISEKNACDCVYTFDQQKELKKVCDSFKKNDKINPRTGRKIKEGSKVYNGILVQCNLCDKKINLDQKLKPLKKMSNDDKKKIDELSKDLQAKNKEIRELMMKIKQLTKIETKLNEKNLSLQEKISVFKEAIRTKTNELKKLSKNLKDNVTIPVSKYKEIEQKIEEYDELVSNYNQLMKSYDDVNQSLNRLNIDYDEYIDEYKKKEQENKTLQEKVLNLSSEMESKEILISKLQQDLDVNNERIQILEQSSTRTQQIQNEYDKLNIQNENILNIIRDLNDALPDEVDENKLNNISIMYRDIARLQLKLQLVLEKNSGYVTIIANLNSELNSLRSMIQRLRQNEVTYENNIQLLRQNEVTYESTIEKMRKQIEIYSTIINGLESENENLSNSKNTADDEIKLLNQQIYELQTENTNLKNEIENLRKLSTTT